MSSEIFTWNGNFSSTSYGKNHVNGVINVDLPKGLKGPYSAKAEVVYTGSYQNEKTISMPVTLECNSSGKNGSGDIDSFNLKCSNSFILWTQIITFTSSVIDLDHGIIKGNYTSTFPSDIGTFELNRIKKN